MVLRVLVPSRPSHLQKNPIHTPSNLSGPHDNTCTGDETRERHDVWAVRVLQDGTMVSGDGGGNLQFWDAAQGSCLATLKIHKADILSIAASLDGQQVFASGADAQIAIFNRINPSEGADFK